MFYIFIFFIFFNSFAKIKGLEIKVQKEDEKREITHTYKIKKLPNAKKDRLIVHQDYYFRTPNVLQNDTVELQNLKKETMIPSIQCMGNYEVLNEEIKNTNTHEKIVINTSSPINNIASYTNTFFNGLCHIYTQNKLENYKLQIETMSLFIRNIFNTDTPSTFLPQNQPNDFLVNNIKQTSDGRLASKVYTCRGFSKVMLLDEENTLEKATYEKNVTYIQGAKSDIKSAMYVNEIETVETIDLIPDIMLTQMIDKYNQIATKGMTEEQLTLIGNTMKNSELIGLQSQIKENYDMIDEYAGTTGTLQEKENADLSPYYSGNPLHLLNSIKDTNGDETEQTQKLRNFRVTKNQRNETEQRLDEMLDAILQLQKEEETK